MESWRDLAVCESLPIETQKAFFGEADGVSTEKQHEKARTYCYTCPVQIDCLIYCIESDTDFGVWGGLTESQRKRYLWPALRRLGRHEWVYAKVVADRGDHIFRLIERQNRLEPEYSPQLKDHLLAAVQA